MNPNWIRCIISFQYIHLYRNDIIYASKICIQEHYLTTKLFLIAAMCIITILGILYDGYDSKHYWWWEIVIQLRKFSVIFISAFIESREQQILLVLFVVVVSLFFTALLRPFYDDRLVRMEMLSLIVCFLTFFFGSMLLTDEKCVEDETLLCIGAQWLVILINAGCVLFLGINFRE